MSDQRCPVCAVPIDGSSMHRCLTCQRLVHPECSSLVMAQGDDSGAMPSKIDVACNRRECLVGARLLGYSITPDHGSVSRDPEGRVWEHTDGEPPFEITPRNKDGSITAVD